jgi:hypothetical protein
MYVLHCSSFVGHLFNSVKFYVCLVCCYGCPLINLTTVIEVFVNSLPFRFVFTRFLSTSYIFHCSKWSFYFCPIFPSANPKIHSSACICFVLFCFVLSNIPTSLGLPGSVIIWGTKLQAIRSRVLFPMKSLYFSFYLSFSAALCSLDWLSL